MLSGKTTVGRLLAAHLKRPFVDLDQAIVEREGLSISEIFDKGEGHFRDCEKSVLKAKLIDPVGSVIATGGGAFEDPETRALALRSGFVVFLSAPAAVLAARYTPDTGRPLLDGEPDAIEGVLQELLLRRRGQYNQAHLSVSVVDKNPTQVCLEIADVIMSRNLG